MEAKDTVMSYGEMKAVCIGSGISICDAVNVALAQAEISFKAGRRSAILDMEKQVADAYKGGVRKVVEWIERESDTAYIFEGEYTYNTKCDNQIMTDLEDWQAQKEEWGVE